MLAGAMLFTASSIFGISVKRIYKERCKLYGELADFTEYLDREIRCLKTPLETNISNYGVRDGVFGTVIKKYSEGLRFGYGSADEIKVRIKSVYLKEEDNLILASFLYSLGRGDYETELTNLSRYKGIFNEKKLKSEKELKQNGDMYYKLAVTLGIAVMLLVV